MVASRWHGGMRMSSVSGRGLPRAVRQLVQSVSTSFARRARNCSASACGESNGRMSRNRARKSTSSGWPYSGSSLADQMRLRRESSRRRTWDLGPRLIAAGQLVVAQPGPAGVHALRRQQRVDRVEIGRGKADLRAAAGAVRDHAANAVRRREQPLCLFDVAGANQLADARAGNESRRRPPPAARHRARCRPRPSARRAARSCPRGCGRNKSSGPSTSARAASASRTIR